MGAQLGSLICGELPPERALRATGEVKHHVDVKIKLHDHDVSSFTEEHQQALLDALHLHVGAGERVEIHAINSGSVVVECRVVHDDMYNAEATTELLSDHTRLGAMLEKSGIGASELHAPPEQTVSSPQDSAPIVEHKDPPLPPGKKPPPPPPVPPKDAEKERVQELIKDSSAGGVPAVVALAGPLAPALSVGLVVIQMTLPAIIIVVSAADWFFSHCPYNLLYAMAGLVICFFGGMFPALLAALEAFQQTGGEDAMHNLSKLYHEVKVVAAAEAKAEKQDAGVMTSSQRVHIAMMAIDPMSVNDAAVGLYCGWIGVVGVLKIKFAKTIARGVAIGHFLKKPVSFIAVPILTHTVPAEYHKFIPLGVQYACKSVAISIAWYIEHVISAFHSAIRGGLMVSRGLLRFLRLDTEKGLFSWLDEVLGWSLAALGFYFQFEHGFTAAGFHWSFRFFLLPFEMAEAYIVWTISE